MESNRVNEKIRVHVNYEDFKSVFKVYEKFRFGEGQAEEKISEEYTSIALKSGLVWGYYIDERCVSILTMYSQIYGEHPIIYPENKKVMYFSSLITLEEYRKRGIATKLLKNALEFCVEHDYEHAYFRTSSNVEQAMFNNIAKECGFFQVSSVNQCNNAQIIDEIKENCCFYEKKLK